MRWDEVSEQWLAYDVFFVVVVFIVDSKGSALLSMFFHSNESSLHSIGIL